jgi:hypothetical protein
MADRKKHADAVIIGYGWTGAIMAKTLTDAGLSVVAIERGPARDTAPDFEYPRIIDELRYGVRGDLWQPLAKETVTVRHNLSEVAQPYRKYGSFVLGNGVGGAGVHWNGQLWRASPEDLRLRSHIEERYGKGFIPEDMTIQNYPVTFEELEPHFDHFEKVCGVSGLAGNLRGEIRPGGNPFEGARSDEYPTPPLPPIYAAELFEKAAAELGYKSFPQPSANSSIAFTNPYGVRLEMIAPFIEETLSAVHVALESASLTSSQVDEILLVGGATRTPLVRKRLLEAFAREARGEVDPDLCVALGAAIQGGAIAGAEVSAVLVDVTPYTFGTSALGELNGELYPYHYVPIIPKNTAIPVRKSEVFFTIVDDQKTVEVRVFQGENADALENIQLGEFRVEGLSEAPAGNPIIIDLALDRDGILHVSATEKNTGLERRITIDKAMSRYDKNELHNARQRITDLFDAEDADGLPVPSGGASGTPAEADLSALVAKAQAKLDEAGDEDRAELIDMVEIIRDCKERGDVAGLEEASRQLGDLLFYLET